MVEWILVILILFDAVYAFSDVFSDDSEINPKDVICDEPLMIPLGTEVISVKSTEPLDVKYDEVAVLIHLLVFV